MKRHLFFLAAAVLWLSLLGPVSGSLAVPNDPLRNEFILNTTLLLWIVVALAIYFGWAQRDSIEHGRGIGTAAMFTVLLLILNLLAHFIYLFYTRGFQNGVLASLRFFVAMLVITGGLLIFNRLGP